MGFSLSPTVTVKEFDKTLTVPGLATSIAAAVGHFQWGPVEEITLVDSEATLVDRFGGPNDTHYADWFPVSNFLGYSNNLKLVRAARNISADYTAGNADLQFVQTPGTVTSVAAGFVTDGFLVGDQLTVSGSASNDGTYEITAVAAGTLTIKGDFLANEGTNDAPATLTAGAFNAISQMIALPTDGTEITEDTVTIDPIFIKNREVLDQIVTNVAQAPFYARYPGTFGNKITVSAFNGAQHLVAPTAFALWDYEAFFDYAPTGDEIWIAVAYDDSNGNAVVVETFLASQDSTSIAATGGTNYWVEMINRTSKYIFAVPPSATTGISHQNDGTSATEVYTGTLSTSPGTWKITPVEFTQRLTLGADSAPIQANYVLGWDLFADGESIDLNFAMQAGAGTLVGKYILENIAEVRLDCIAVMSPNESDVVGDPTPATTIAALRTGDLSKSSSYGIIDGNYKKQYDKYNDIYRWVAFNGDIAGLMARTDDIRDPWWSPAGLNRGNIKNVFQLAFNPTKAQRDEMFRVGINPIVSFKGEGTVLWGDKTAQTKPSAFDHINVRRLFLTIEKAIATAAKYQLFEFNDEITRNNFKNLVEPYLRNVQGRRGIQDFRVVCDKTNNTGEVIDRNEFVADIYIKPNRSINEIQLNFIAVKSGVSFEEVILTAAT